MGVDPEPPSTAVSALERCVTDLAAALAERGVPGPGALWFLATGTDFLRGRLRNERQIELGELEGCPAAWSDARLLCGHEGGEVFWVLEDRNDEPGFWDATRPWLGGLPVWLAARAGARFCVHASAGCWLSDQADEPSLLLATDHLNLSACNPLAGLGESRLGPLFPNLSRLHDADLRTAARHCAAGIQLQVREGLVACGAGPALETPAERRTQAAHGALVAVQGLAVPLLACAHAGLATLAVVSPLATAAEERDGIDLVQITARSTVRVQDLERLLEALLPAVARHLQACPADEGVRALHAEPHRRTDA